jgi:hypothetical protein
MGRGEILDKLNVELEKDITSECQVVYILSRIRKYLEFDNKRQEYKYLNFYCNWAMHTQIDRTEPMVDELVAFINNKDKGFLNFDYFKNDLLKFLKEKDLSTKVIDDAPNFYRFINLLIDIYTDTPLIVKGIKTTRITISKPEIPVPGFAFSIAFNVEYLE